MAHFIPGQYNESTDGDLDANGGPWDFGLNTTFIGTMNLTDQEYIGLDEVTVGFLEGTSHPRAAVAGSTVTFTLQASNVGTLSIRVQPVSNNLNDVIFSQTVNGNDDSRTISGQFIMPQFAARISFSGYDTTGTENVPYTFTLGGSGGTTPPPGGTDDFAANTGTTGQISPSGSVTGNLESAGDRDWFRTTLSAGTTYTIDLLGSATSSGTLSDPYLRIYNSSGSEPPVRENDDSGNTTNSQVTFTPSATGTYFIGAGSYNDSGTGTYRISVSGQQAPAGPPDLRATMNGLNASSLPANGDITINYSISNQGTGPAAASKVGLYYSADATISTSDHFLFDIDREALSASDSVGAGISFNLQSIIPLGNWYIGVIADYNNAIAESSESNNASSGAALKITPVPGQNNDYSNILPTSTPPAGMDWTNAAGTSTSNRFGYQSSLARWVYDGVGTASEWGNDTLKEYAVSKVAGAFWDQADDYINAIGNKLGVATLFQKIHEVKQFKDNFVNWFTNDVDALTDSLSGDIINEDIDDRALHRKLDDSAKEFFDETTGVPPDAESAGKSILFGLLDFSDGDDNELRDQAVQTSSLTAALQPGGQSFGFAVGPVNGDFVGTSGRDGLIGGKQNDTLRGGAGADILFGADGNDSLYGGAGSDRLMGGRGADAFRFAAPSEGGDTILDYSHLDADQVFLDRAGFGLARGGSLNNAGVDFVQGSAPRTASPTILVSGSDAYFDPDGSGVAPAVLLAHIGVAAWDVAATGHFNRDGATDLLWKNAGTGQTIAWMMDGNGGIGFQTSLPSTIGYELAASGDFDGNGTDDFLWRNISTGRSVEWLMSTSGALGGQAALPATNGYVAAGVGDFNGDGTTDVVWKNVTSGQTIAWLMSPSGGISLQAALFNTNGWDVAAVGDFDANGTKDFLWKNASTGQTIEWLMSKAGGVGFQAALPGLTGWTLAAMGDLDNNRTDDFLWKNTATGQTVEWLTSKAGGIGFQAALSNVNGYELAAHGDFDANGTEDFIWRNSSSGQTIEWLTSTSGGVGYQTTLPNTSGYSVVASGDFNRDGFDDVIWQHGKTGQTIEWLMTNTGGIGAQVSLPSSAGWSVLSSGDFNADGTTDLIWERASDGRTSQWLMAPGSGNILANPTLLGTGGLNVVHLTQDDFFVA